MIRLCSSSESRALLLRKFGIEFIQEAPEYDEEQITTTVAKDFVYMASKGKMEAAVKAFGLEMPLLCADSVIMAADGSILRKAKDVDDARRIFLPRTTISPLLKKRISKPILRADSGEAKREDVWWKAFAKNTSGPLRDMRVQRWACRSKYCCHGCNKEMFFC